MHALTIRNFAAGLFLVAAVGCGDDVTAPVLAQGAYQGDTANGAPFPIRQVAFTSSPPCSVDLSNAFLTVLVGNKYNVGGTVILHCNAQADHAGSIREDGTYTTDGDQLILEPTAQTGLQTTGARMSGASVIINYSIYGGDAVSVHFNRFPTVTPD